MNYVATIFVICFCLWIVYDLGFFDGVIDVVAKLVAALRDKPKAQLLPPTGSCEHCLPHKSHGAGVNFCRHCGRVLRNNQELPHGPKIQTPSPFLVALKEFNKEFDTSWQKKVKARNPTKHKPHKKSP